jgi:hypothetical protein
MERGKALVKEYAEMGVDYLKESGIGGEDFILIGAAILLAPETGGVSLTVPFGKKMANLLPYFSKTGLGKSVLSKGSEFIKKITAQITQQNKVFPIKPVNIKTGLTRDQRNNFTLILQNSDKKSIIQSCKKQGWNLNPQAIDKIPQDMLKKNGVQPSKGGIGIKVGDKQNSIRIMQGKPNGHDSQKVDYVKITKNGQVIDKNGKPILGEEMVNGVNFNPADNPRSHITLSDWLKSNI